MPKLLQIAQLGNSILRRKAAVVKDIKQEKIQELIDDLILTVKDSDGVGIAAPQIYESKQIFILASHPNSRYPKAPKMAPLAVVNPKIITYSGQIIKDWEGCLSIPGIKALVPRYKSILVEFIDRKGKLQSRRFQDFVARIFQHEFDHLDGIVFLDRVETNKEIITEKEYQKLMLKK